jgi:predicted nucleic acid-binding protein
VPAQRYLIDTSALARAHIQSVGDRVEALALAGRFWTCRTVDLEVVYASRARDVADVVEERRALPEAPITPAVMDRALQVAALLASAGHHRRAKPADLVIAAAAEASGLAVLHYDDDYDRIAAVTNQSTEWIMPKGSLPH